jgi:hypothetical protein
MNRHEKIMLPVTEEAFDLLVNDLVQEYKLPNLEHAAAVIANRIMHLPADQADVVPEYLAHCVLKNVAYQIAQSKGRMLAHKSQVDILAAELKINPLNQEATDALEKAASEGSEYAKKALQERSLTSEPAPILNLVQRDPRNLEAVPGSTG